MAAVPRRIISRDAEYVATMRQIIGMGYTHLDTAESYGKNHCEEIVGQAIKAFDRKDIFVTTKVAPEHLHADDVIKAAEGSLRRLEVDAIDLYLIHWPNAQHSAGRHLSRSQFLACRWSRQTRWSQQLQR